MPRGKGTLGAARSRKNEVRPDYLLFWIRQEFAVQASDRRGKGYTPAFSRHGGKRCERPWAHGAEERVEQVRKVPGSGFGAVSIRSILAHTVRRPKMRRCVSIAGCSGRHNAASVVAVLKKGRKVAQGVVERWPRNCAPIVHFGHADVHCSSQITEKSFVHF